MNPIIQKRYDKAGPRVAAALSRPQHGGLLLSHRD